MADFGWVYDAMPSSVIGAHCANKFSALITSWQDSPGVEFVSCVENIDNGQPRDPEAGVVSHDFKSP